MVDGVVEEVVFRFFKVDDGIQICDVVFDVGVVSFEIVGFGVICLQYWIGVVQVG